MKAYTRWHDHKQDSDCYDQLVINKISMIAHQHKPGAARLKITPTSTRQMETWFLPKVTPSTRHSATILCFLHNMEMDIVYITTKIIQNTVIINKFNLHTRAHTPKYTGHTHTHSGLHSPSNLITTPYVQSLTPLLTAWGNKKGRTSSQNRYKYYSVLFTN